MRETEQRLTITLTEETLPPRDPTHGTPHAMVRRMLVFALPEGEGHWEQTDYGHPGRFNPWDPRGTAAALQSRTEAMRTAAEAIGELLA